MNAHRLAAAKKSEIFYDTGLKKNSGHGSASRYFTDFVLVAKMYMMRRFRQADKNIFCG